MDWLFIFLLLYGTGCLLSLLFIKQSEIPKGFFITCITVALALIAIPIFTGNVDVKIFNLLLNTSGVALSHIIAPLYIITLILVLGFSLINMILGHWYLVNTRLSFAPLVRVSHLLIYSILARAVVAAILLFSNVNAISNIDDVFNVLLLIVRFFVGLLGAFILSIMVLKCALLRSNQSATGILYALVVFVIVGELASVYLTIKEGLPV